MSQRYNDNIKMAKPYDIQLGNLRFMHFAAKFSTGSQVKERALLELCSICLCEYTQKLSRSRKGAVGA